MTTDTAPRPRHWLLRRTPTDLPYYLILFQTVVSLVVSPLPERSLQAVWPHALGLALYYVIVRRCWTERALGWAWWGLVAVLGGLCLLGPAGMAAEGIALPGPLAILGRLGARLGDTFNPNVVAGYLVLLLPFALARALAPLDGGRRGWAAVGRIAAGLVALGALAALYLTESRGGLLAAGVGLVALVALRWPRATLILAPLALAGVVLAALRLDGRAALDALTVGQGTSGMEERVEIWSRAVYVLQDFSFTGLGFGCFEPVVELFYPLFLVPAGTTTHAHNLILQVGVDLGLPGLVAAAALVGLTAWLGVAAYRRAPKATARRALVAAGAAVLLSVLTQGVIDAAIWGNKAAFLTWGVLALLAALAEPGALPAAEEPA